MSAATATATQTASRTGKYLSFQLAEEDYAIQVLRVREIVKLQHITSVPETPPEVKGVINLRGRIIPVIDLRLKFGMPGQDYDHHTCIIVVEPQGTEHGPIGIVVDEVSDVLTLTEADIQNTPDFGGGFTSPYLLGMAKVQDRVKILLDIDSVLATADLAALHAAIR
jgi:purine-binding chemotaxis protein CheW